MVFADTTDAEEFDLDFDLFHDVPRAPSARDLSKVGPLGRNHKNDLADALRVEKRSRRVRPTSKSQVR